MAHDATPLSLELITDETRAIFPPDFAGNAQQPILGGKLLDNVLVSGSVALRNPVTARRS